MALSNPYADLERRDVHLTEWRVHVESLLDEAEVSSLETRVPVRKGHNF